MNCTGQEQMVHLIETHLKSAKQNKRVNKEDKRETQGMDESCGMCDSKARGNESSREIKQERSDDKLGS